MKNKTNNRKEKTMKTRYDKKGYLTRAALVKEIKDVVDIKDLRIKFDSRWQITKFPSGLIKKAAFVILTAPGFKTSMKMVEQKANCRWSMG